MSTMIFRGAAWMELYKGNISKD